jgi:hypothetical protein
MQQHPSELPEVEPSRVWTMLGDEAQYRIIKTVASIVLKTLSGSAQAHEPDNRPMEVPYE